MTPRLWMRKGGLTEVKGLPKLALLRAQPMCSATALYCPILDRPPWWLNLERIWKKGELGGEAMESHHQ